MRTTLISLLLLCFIPNIAHTQTADELYQLGRNKAKEEKFKQAVKLYSKAIKANPNHFKSYCYRGEAYSELDKFDLALTDLDKAISIDSTFPDSYLNRSFLYYITKKYQDAIVDFTKSIDMNHEVGMSYYFRAQSHLMLDQVDSAIVDLTAAIEMSLKEDYSDYALRASLNHVLDYDIAALKDYNKAIELKPDQISYYNKRGEVKLSLNDNRGAIEDFDIFLKETPNDPDAPEALTNRGTAKYNLGNKSEAIIDLTKSIDKGPNKYFNYYLRGRIYEEMELHEKAILDFNQMIVLEPEWGDSYRLRGISKLNNGDTNDACIDWINASNLGEDVVYLINKFCN